MPVQKVKVIVRTPDWRFCNCKGRKRGTKTTEKCRFCKEYKKRGQDLTYWCLLYDKPLSTSMGNVEKTLECLGYLGNLRDIDQTNSPMDNNTVDSTEVAAQAKLMKQVAARALRKQQKLANEFVKEGIPVDAAYDIATKQSIEEWS